MSGLVKAWECGYCGMLVKAEDDKETPDRWLRIYWHKGGMNTEVNQVVCSGKCASKSFLAADEQPPPKRRRAKRVPTEVTGLGGTVHECPECGVVYNLPQHLGAHRKRAHGVASKRDTVNRRR